MTHKPKKVAKHLCTKKINKKFIYYRGAKLWCETKKGKNPYGSWRKRNMYFLTLTIASEEVYCVQWTVRQTPESNQVMAN